MRTLLPETALALAAVCGAQAEPLDAASRDAFLKEVEKAMSGVQTIVATFAQAKHSKLFGGVVETEGCILYTRPDKLRWEIRAPFRSILIVAGREVAKFEFADDERRRLKLGRTGDVLLVVMDQIRSWFRGDFAKGMKDYDVRAFAAAAGAKARIELRPKEAALRRNLECIELVLSEDLSSVDRVEVREHGGDKTVMTFTPLCRNAELAAGYHDLEDPRAFDPDAFRAATSKPTSRPGR